MSFEKAIARERFELGATHSPVISVFPEVSSARKMPLSTDSTCTSNPQDPRTASTIGETPRINQSNHGAKNNTHNTHSVARRPTIESRQHRTAQQNHTVPSKTRDPNNIRHVVSPLPLFRPAPATRPVPTCSQSSLLGTSTITSGNMLQPRAFPTGCDERGPIDGKAREKQSGHAGNTTRGIPERHARLRRTGPTKKTLRTVRGMYFLVTTISVSRGNGFAGHINTAECSFRASCQASPTRVHASPPFRCMCTTT